MSKHSGKDKQDDDITERRSDTALIIHPVLSEDRKNMSEEKIQNLLEEAEGLAHAISLEVIDCHAVNVARINPGLFLGKGAVEDTGNLIDELRPDIVIINHDLSPVQQRNLERAWEAKVIDRTGLILEIFGERAQTKEGKIQVELAALEYQRSRLVRSWTHLERQRGGAGFMGGPGETQIELDRRIIGERIVKLKKELQAVKRTRDLARKSRERVPFPVVALVGYTNAGKSTLFNHMTGANVFAKDLLFATLDPTMRKVRLKNGRDFILSDTVGFISDLPTTLVAAFRSTLEQVEYADVILHVRDISQENTDSHKQDVVEIMQDLGIEYEQDDRIIEVLNKTDLLDKGAQQDIERKARFSPIKTICISAINGTGLDDLLDCIEEALTKKQKQYLFSIPPVDGEAMAWLYNHGRVINRTDTEDIINVETELFPSDLGRFIEKFGYQPLNEEDHQSRAIN